MMGTVNFFRNLQFGYGAKKVSDHERAQHYLLDATEGAEFRPKILAMGYVWRLNRDVGLLPAVE